MRLDKQEISKLSTLAYEDYYRYHYVVIRREDIGYWADLAQGIADNLSDAYPSPLAGTTEYYMVRSAQDLALWLQDQEADCEPADLVIADLTEERVYRWQSVIFGWKRT